MGLLTRGFHFHEKQRAQRSERFTEHRIHARKTHYGRSCKQQPAVVRVDSTMKSAADGSEAQNREQRFDPRSHVAAPPVDRSLGPAALQLCHIPDQLSRRRTSKFLSSQHSTWFGAKTSHLFHTECVTRRAAQPERQVTRSALSHRTQMWNVAFSVHNRHGEAYFLAFAQARKSV